MIRQARAYLLSAMSGATLIAVAIAAFVVLVSAQVFTDWPVGALGDGGGDAALSTGKPVAGGAGGSPVSGGATGRAASAAAKGGGAGQGNGDGAAPDAGGDGSSPGGQAGGGEGGSAGGSPGGDSTSSGGAAAPAGGGGETARPSGASSSGAGPSASGGGGGGAPAVPKPTAPTSSQVTSTVDETVNQVDESALGGSLDQAGVTGATEEVVNGVAGPESTAGKAVDGTVGTVEGVLGGSR